MDANDDLILVLDIDTELKLEDDQLDDITLEDDVPYSKHYDEYTGS